MGAACQPITPLVDPPTIELVNEPVKPDPYPYNPEYTYPFRPATDKRTYMRAMRARCARRFPGCKQCDEHLKRCVYWCVAQGRAGPPGQAHAS